MEGRSLEDFRRNRTAQLAVERCLEIMGEAASRLNEETIEQIPSLPINDMRAMRNLLIHAYFQVDLQEVWNTAQNDIPKVLELLIPLEETLIDLIQKG